MKQQILQLRSEGKSYDQIKLILGCSKSTISFHCGIGQKQKTLNRTRKRRAKHPFIKKIESFIQSKHVLFVKKIPIHKTKKLIQLKCENFSRDRKTGNYIMPNFTVDEVLNHIGENPICYLTGRSIDINQPRTYQFDHIVPVTRGGTNDLNNLAIASKDANYAKSNLSKDEFLQLCLEVVKHNKLI